MQVFKTALLGLLFPLFLSMAMHKFYVSVTEIEYVKEKKSVQIISRIFIDDLENALRARYKDGLTFAEHDEAPEVEIFLEKYLNDKLQITINGKQVMVKFLGKEYDNDIVFCYLEVTGVNQIDSFEVSNTVLFDRFDDQQNIIKLKIYDKNKSFILIEQNDKALLKF